MPAKMKTNIKIKIKEEKPGKGRVEGVGFVSNQDLIDEGICPECGGKLPAPVREDRGEGHSELVTYCNNCGSTFVS